MHGLGSQAVTQAGRLVPSATSGPTVASYQLIPVRDSVCALQVRSEVSSLAFYFVDDSSATLGTATAVTPTGSSDIGTIDDVGTATAFGGSLLVITANTPPQLLMFTPVRAGLQVVATEVIPAPTRNSGLVWLREAVVWPFSDAFAMFVQNSAVETCVLAGVMMGVQC